MYHHISPREELIRQAKELKKSIYKIDETMQDAEYEIEYSKDQGHKTADSSFFGYKMHIAMKMK